MRTSRQDANQRRGNRTKAVLPVRMKGKDSSGELVHTLDVTQTGVRLGSVRREMVPLDEVTLFFRQRKIQFRVVWVQKMKGTSEFQVGLQAMSEERDAWGLNLPEQKNQPVAATAASHASGMA